jgi:hypothetical protein
MRAIHLIRVNGAILVNEEIRRYLAVLQESGVTVEISVYEFLENDGPRPRMGLCEIDSPRKLVSTLNFRDAFSAERVAGLDQDRET